MPGTVRGERGGFIVTRGKPRFAQLEGVPYAVGRGRAVKCTTVAEAYAKRDEWLTEEASAIKAKREAAAAPVACALKVGDRVRIDQGEGVVEEVGPRSVLVRTPGGACGAGEMWRRAPSACVLV